MNHYYLWREEIPDSLECDYDLAPKDFFLSLLSPKDRFSYFTKNLYYSNPSEYGFAYQRYLCKEKEDIYKVLYIRNNELKRQGMRRGDLVDIQNKNGCYIYSKFDYDGSKLTRTHIRYKESVNTRSIGNSNTVLLDSVYYIHNRKIGYICYLEFDRISDLDKPLKMMYNSNIEDLILDLRYNPGGYVNTCQFLCNCILPSNAYNNIFQKCSYNDILSEEFLASTGFPYTLSHFQTPPAPGESVLGSTVIPLNQKRVFFLTSSNTASASEAAIICLRPYMDVIVIGEPTVGKGVGSWTIYDPKYKYAIQPITMRYYNALDETTPDDGIAPDYYVEDGYSTSKKEIGDINEPLLKTAIDIILGNTSRYTQVAKTPTKEECNILIPIGEPSFVTDFRNKQIREMK